MRSFKLSLLALVCFTVPTLGQLAQTGAGMTGAAAPAGYSGPGDITSSAIAFYSCGRAYNAAYATGLNAACDVVDTSTGLVTCTLHFLSTGFVNTTECNATACATACSVTRMYNQAVASTCSAGGTDVCQATLANMPRLTFNAQNGLPCAAGTNNAAMNLLSSGTITRSAPYTIMAVGERTGNFTTSQQIMINTVGGGSLFWRNIASSVRIANTTNVGLVATDSAFHAFLGVASGTAPLFAVDSSSNISTASSGTVAMTGNISLMGSGVGTSGLLSGFVCEAGIWPADLNSSYQAMLANMRSATNGWNF